MICQIYSVQTPQEAVDVIRAGADHIGVVPGNCNIPGGITNEMAKRIFESVGDSAVKVALSIADDPQEIICMAQELKPDIVHISGPNYVADPQLAEDFDRLCPGVKIMQAIPVTGPECIEKAKVLSGFVDYLILDSVSNNAAGIGASGITNDWSVGRQIVEASSVPVILAGGLCSRNVTAAIWTVRPWGVDSMTRTDRVLANGESLKDIEKVAAFCRAAKGEGL